MIIGLGLGVIKSVDAVYPFWCLLIYLCHFALLL
jgi:hypothetical protein